MKGPFIPSGNLYKFLTLEGRQYYRHVSSQFLPDDINRVTSIPSGLRDSAMFLDYKNNTRHQIIKDMNI